MADWPEGKTAVVEEQDVRGGVYLEGHGKGFYNSLQLVRVG